MKQPGLPVAIVIGNSGSSTPHQKHGFGIPGAVGFTAFPLRAPTHPHVVYAGAAFLPTAAVFGELCMNFESLWVTRIRKSCGVGAHNYNHKQTSAKKPIRDLLKTNGLLVFKCFPTSKKKKKSETCGKRLVLLLLNKIQREQQKTPN